MHAHFEKRKFRIQSVVILLKNGCSVRHIFCTIFVPLFIAKVLEKHIGSSSYLILAFFKENSHSHEKFTKRLFQIFQTDIFQNPHFCLRTEKSTKFINKS